MANEALNLGSLFLEGLLAFFSPCVLPLIPLYIGYLTQGTAVKQADGTVKYSRGKTFLITVFFVLGICTVFLILGMGTSALRSFFTGNTILFEIIGGILLILFGLISMHVIHISFLEKEYRVDYSASGKMTGLKAYLTGFFFSFAWSPCVGPYLATALVTAGNASTAAMGYLYIAVYALGFVILFLALGLFTEEMLNFFEKKKHIIKYTQIIGGVIMIVMGAYMLVQAGNSITQIQSSGNDAAVTETAQPSVSAETSASAEASAPAETEDTRTDIEKYDFELQNQNGEIVHLSDYKGKKIILNFFGTWCTYCKQELPYLQTLNDTRDDVKVLLVAAPNSGSEGSIASIEKFMQDNGYTMEVVFDSSYTVTESYGISGYPTTYIFKADGNALGYVPGYVEESTMESYLEQADE